MKEKIYTENEIDMLKQNPFVIDVKHNRFIEYDPLFKLWAVLEKRKHPEITCKELFFYAGFNVNLMNPKLPQSRIKSWNDLFYRYGYDYFLDETTYATLLKIHEKNINYPMLISKIEDFKEAIYSELLNLLKENADFKLNKGDK